MSYNNTNKNIKFSIIMPTYNRAFCITKAIDSLLKQTYRDYELIIVDDGSTDNTENILKEKYQEYFENKSFLYIRQNKIGVCKARNLGLKFAKNEWIAYLDSDNEILPDFLESFCKAIVKNKNKCYYAQIMHSKQGIIGKKFNYRKLCKANYIDLGVFVHHISLFEKYGGFDVALKRLVDWDLIIRYTKKESPFFIQKALLNYNADDTIERISNVESVQLPLRAIRKKIKRQNQSKLNKYLKIKKLKLIRWLKKITNRLKK